MGKLNRSLSANSAVPLDYSNLRQPARIHSQLNIIKCLSLPFVTKLEND